MDYFLRLGQRVQDAWRAHHFNEEAFPEIAETQLKDDPAHLLVTAADIVNWMKGTASLPAQADTGSSFGQPPVTLFAGRGFHIDVYFWLDGITSIHQHSFSGAFQVLAGSSVHGVYEFGIGEVVNSHLRFGDVRLKRIELLKMGDFRRIYGGSRFIHSLFHLDRPSATVVVRTYGEPSWSPQYEYLPPCVAVDAFLDDRLLRKRIEFAHLLWETDRPSFYDFVSGVLADGDALSSFRLLRHCARHWDYGDRFAEILEKAPLTNGRAFSALGPVFSEEKRKELLVERRRRIRGADHRFLLALLLNVPDRESTLRVIQEKFPGTDGLTTLMRWLQELAALPSPVNPGEPNALGIPMDDDTLLLLKGFLQGLSTPQMREVLIANGYDSEDVDSRRVEIETLRDTFSASPMFKTLFA
jgi:hypothetical protein